MKRPTRRSRRDPLSSLRSANSSLLEEKKRPCRRNEVMPRSSVSLRDKDSALTVAERAERYAEGVNTSDAWLVTADAWEEASQPDRARFAYLRQPHLNFHIISNAEAASIRRRYDAWYEIVGQPGSFSAVYGEARAKAIREMPSNEEKGQLEIYEFLREPPTHKFAYYNDNFSEVRTFVGDVLGTITNRGKVTRAYGGGGSPRLQHVNVRGINGYIYNGTCNLDTGTYCKLKRGKAWLRR